MKPTKVFLCGDVMTGRGIDQILKYPSSPEIFESYVRDARDYVKLGEKYQNKIPRMVDPEYIWGDALKEWKQRKVNASIVNLETSITKSDHYWPNKGINYRMNPKNIDVLTCAKFDACSLANNHILDWGEEGLLETILTLKKSGIKFCGAGRNIHEAQKAAILNLPEGNRLLIFSIGLPSSGIPETWEATETDPGVYLLRNIEEGIYSIERQLRKKKRKEDIVIISVHWGGNWGYIIPHDHIKFAHMIIDNLDVDIIHGHSSHHPLGLEIYRKKLILYGCGDFINDYEGISGMDSYRSDIHLMYFLSIDSTNKELLSLEIVPLKTMGFSLHYASEKDSEWITNLLNEKSKQFDMIFKKTQSGQILASRKSA